MSSESEEETSSEMPVKPSSSKAEKGDEDSETESGAKPPPTTKRKRKNEVEESKKKKKEQLEKEGSDAEANGVEGKKKQTKKKGGEKKGEEEKKKGGEKKGEEEKKKGGENKGEEEKKKKKKNSEKQPAEDPKEKQQQQQDPKEKPAASAAAGTSAEAQKVKPGSKNSWLPRDETLMAKQMLEDLKKIPGLNFDEKPKGDNYWNQLQDALKDKLSRDFNADQIFDKHKRMKLKFKKYEQDQADVTKSTKKRKQAVDELHGIFKQLWSSEEVAAAKPGASGFGSKLGVNSDGEESNGEFPGFPALTSVKKEALEAKGLANGKSILGPVAETTGAGAAEAAGANDLSRVMKNFLLETISQVSSVAGADPVISFGSSLCAGVESLMKSYKLGFEASTASREVKKRLLEEQAAEYSAMKRRLKLVLDYCELEEEVLKKKLEAM